LRLEAGPPGGSVVGSCVGAGMDDSDDFPVSDEDREAAVERLRVANAQGRMDLTELIVRSRSIAEATTRGELVSITSVLAEQSSHPPALRPDHHWTVAVFGDVTRSGSWRAQDKLTPISLFGDVDLDFRQARVTGGEVEVTAVTPFGDIDALVPHGVEVEVTGFTLFGSKRIDAESAAPMEAGPTVRVRAFTLFGSVKVRSV
jgi:hypothetical protein